MLVPIFLTTGTIYAVFLAFLVVAVWESYDAAHANVAEEASSLATLYRESAGMDAGASSALRSLIKEYTEAVIQDEWRVQAATGGASPKAREAGLNMFRLFRQLPPAVRQGDGWVLNGSKTFITNGSHANCAVVMALTDKAKSTHGGITGFVVERGTAGFRSGKKENKLGLRASDTAELIFEDCTVPAENMLGTEGSGFKDAMRVLDGGRISIAALALGIARGALDAAMKYATQRRQFGKAISEFQAIQFKLATMATELDAAWLLTMRAAQMKDAGLNVTLESSMAKLYSSEVACRICDEGVQIHGGYGFIKDYPAEKFYRDVKLCTIGEGTSEIQRIVIARELLKRL